MGSGTVYQGGSYYQGLFPGPTGPPNESWPDADAPINSSDVTNSNVPPQIVAGAPYVQPGTDAPSDNPQIDASSSVAKPGPNMIAADAVFVQPNAENPLENPAVDASTAQAGANAPN